MQPNNDGFNENNMDVPPAGTPAPMASQPSMSPVQDVTASVPPVTGGFSETSVPPTPSQPVQMTPPVIEQPKPTGFMGKLKSIFTKKI